MFPSTTVLNKLYSVTRINLFESDCVELVLPADINGVVKVVRVINALHRVFVLMDKDDSESIGNEFRAETSDRKGLHVTNFVELA